MLKTRKNPSSTRSSCVAKSTIASTTFSAAASWTPTTLTETSTRITTIPTTTSHGFSLIGAQKIER